MMYYDDEPMDQDPYAEDSQQPTQSTQEASQPYQTSDKPWDDHLWGYLVPCRDHHPREDFWKVNPTIRVGRSSGNDITLSSLRISNKHCEIEWDGRTEASIVKILDLSSNGTFINGIKIGKNITAILRDGNEVGFGTWGSTNPDEDFRYIFRFNASGPPLEGIHAKYDLGHELGKGSFATVMSAVERATGDTYAVKIIHKSKFRTQNNETVKLFLREISILETLNHPNICSLKETFFGETIYLVLEYVSGGDLLDHIVSYGGLNEQQARDLTRQLCSAMKYIHAKGIAHRDLKPENVLLTRDNPPVLKVADFGLAKAVDSMTKFKTTCGTPCYLAPEVILRDLTKDGYDELVDAWSVGVIVFCMLSNSSPFFDEDEAMDMRRRFSVRAVDWSLLSRGVSNLAKDFIARLLRFDPKTRMSCTMALEHPWLANPITLPPPRIHSPMYGNGNGIGQDLSVVSIGDAGMVFGHEGAGGESFVNVEVDEGSVNSLGSQVHSPLTPVPGDFPSSQGGGGVRRPIVRRAHDLEQRDPEGILQQLDLIAPGETPGETSAQGAAAANAQNGQAADANGTANEKTGRKRKGQAGADDMEESDGSLTPAEEGAAEDAEISPGRANRGGYHLRNVKKKQDSPDAKAPKSRRK